MVIMEKDYIELINHNILEIRSFTCWLYSLKNIISGIQ